MSEAQVHQSVLAIKVEEDREGPFIFIQRAATDHSQLLQRKAVKLVCSDKDVARHFSNSLQAEARQQNRRDEHTGMQQLLKLRFYQTLLTVLPEGKYELYGYGS